MKKFLSIALAAAMTLSLAGCGAQQQPTPEAETSSTALTDDSEYQLLPDAENPLPEGVAGGTIALAAAGDIEGATRDAAIWRGVQAFAANFGFTASSFTAEGEGAEAAQDALRQAAESGAQLVVCAGEDMAVALYNLQNNYPSVSYLMLDDEPHSTDYISYTTAESVSCVLFQEEQAGFFAGYAAVMAGYTELGYLGSEPIPGVVRYATGFMQGAETAAERNGLQIHIKTWYCGSDTANDDITARMSGWYSDGTQLIFAGAGELVQACTDAAQDTDGKVIAANWDQLDAADSVLTTAQKRYSTVVQEQLFSFYAAGGKWDAVSAGQTTRVGVTDMAVGLPTREWRLGEFTTEEYATVYEQLRVSTVKVERYSDAGVIPEMANVTVDAQN